MLKITFKMEVKTAAVCYFMSVNYYYMNLFHLTEAIKEDGG